MVTDTLAEKVSLQHLALESVMNLLYMSPKTLAHGISVVQL